MLQMRFRNHIFTSQSLSYGHIIDEAYSSMLLRKTNLKPDEIICLDRIQKGLDLPADAEDALRELRKGHLIEGRRPRIRISKDVEQVVSNLREQSQLILYSIDHNKVNPLSELPPRSISADAKAKTVSAVEEKSSSVTVPGKRSGTSQAVAISAVEELADVSSLDALNGKSDWMNLLA